MKFLKYLSLAIVILLVIFCIFLLIVSILEYKPKDIEISETHISEDYDELKLDEKIRILTFNIGYAGLDETQDFFMDGGKSVMPDDKSIVENNLEKIIDIIGEINSDINFLQEVDVKSKRSYGIDEKSKIAKLNKAYTFAPNFKTTYVPIPLRSPIGKVHSGIMTTSKFSLENNSRISLPVPFKWPVSMFNLKRCLLVSDVYTESGKKLVLVNLHLEAYDDTGGREEQTKVLLKILHDEYEKGNYVIAGGDWNQLLVKEDENIFRQKNPELWNPPTIDFKSLEIESGWKLLSDLTLPTSRVNNQPYDEKSYNTQHYIIDGFLVSPNIEVNYVKTYDKKFKYSDHNPVEIEVILKSR